MGALPLGGAASSVSATTHLPPCHAAQLLPLASPRCHIQVAVPQTLRRQGALCQPRSRSPAGHRPLPADCLPRLCCRHAGPGRGRWTRLVPNAARCVAIHSFGSVAARAALLGCDSPVPPLVRRIPLRLALTTSNPGYQSSSCGYCKSEDTSQRTPDSRALSPHDRCAPHLCPLSFQFLP